ncbi:MAG: flagellar biosynthetic protein FliR [Polyangiaceae bacterium]|nr:flagellar biosynthetic protein FliR [Polyangiaceae bacterium]
MGNEACHRLARGYNQPMDDLSSMRGAADLFGSVRAALALTEGELENWMIAWARFVPTVTLVPAFGLRALPAAARVVLGLALSAAVAGVVRPTFCAGPWALQMLAELMSGLPVAVSAAVALWTATMAGGVMDDLRASRQVSALPNVESGATVSGALFAMLAALVFLQSGGAARVASSLAHVDSDLRYPLMSAARQLAAGIELAVAVATPIVICAIVVEVAGALIARAATPAAIERLLAPLRSVVLLAASALLLDRMVALVVLRAAHAG